MDEQPPTNQPTCDIVFFQGFKDLYGQAFGLYALSYYHMATGDAEVSFCLFDEQCRSVFI